MGFVEDSYNVLSPASLASWPSSSSTQEEAKKNQSKKINPKLDTSKDQSAQGSQEEGVFLECKSWLLGRLKGLHRNDKPNHGYQQPPKWKRFFRKCRAQSRKMQSSCYESICVEPQPLHHYKTESYERNFDRGREYWQDLPFLDISPFCSPSMSQRMGSSAASCAWDEAPLQKRSNNVDCYDQALPPLWQRRMSAPPLPELKLNAANFGHAS